jgi:hypothetical protein
MTWTASETPGDAPQAYNPFVDPAGLGVRTIGCDTFSGELLEVLRLTPDLGAPGVIEPLVRQSCDRFASASLAGLVPISRVERTFDGQLEVWSRQAPGFRLSAVLEWVEARGAAPPLNTALTIGDQLLGSLVSLQAVDQTEGASGHGAIAIDQIVLTETGVLTLTDYAYGTALTALQWPRERLWRRFRIAMPPAAGTARFDHRVDVTQAAVVIASLLAGRVFTADEYPRDLGRIIAEAVRRSSQGVDRTDRDRLGVWLQAATEFDPRTPFQSAAQAREALRRALGQRVEDVEGIGQWLRTARGVPDSTPARPRPVAAPPPPVRAQVTDPAEPAVTSPPPPPVAPPPVPPDDTAAQAGPTRRWLRWS